MDLDADKKRIFAAPEKYACLRKIKEIIDERPDEDDEDVVDEVDFEYKPIEEACKEMGIPVTSEGTAHAVKIMRAYAATLGYNWELGMWNKYPFGPLRRDVNAKKKVKAESGSKKKGLFKKKDKEGKKDKDQDEKKEKKDDKKKKDKGKDKKDKSKGKKKDKKEKDEEDEDEDEEEQDDDFDFYSV